ncbi:MAG: sigma-70 family RNA polymerase sigma factor [Pirellulales bacterium]|nr:sigma-70 family RNA polymerase sigma factor [Pirellulales bacterium]
MADEPSSTVLRKPLDSAVVGELYDAMYDPIHRYCARRLYFREQAEDAVSDIFLTMVRRIGDFRGKTLGDFRAWLYVIAANHVNQVLRRILHNERFLELVAEQVRQHQPNSRAGRWGALYRAILALDEEQQHLINLRFFEGLSHDEIARLVRRRPGSVRVKIHRALRSLRPTLQRMLDDEFVSEDGYGR